MGWDWRVSLNGMITFNGREGGARMYTELYRSGIVEAVDAYILRKEKDTTDWRIPHVAFEKRILEAVADYLKFLTELGIGTPVYIALSLLGVRGIRMSSGDSFFEDEQRYPIDREALLLPAIPVEDASQPAERIMRPALDMVWNACGRVESPNFDSEGNWRPRKSY